MMAILARMRTVHRIVGAHHRRHAAFLHCHLEGKQVQLVEHPVGDRLVHRVSVRFLVVGDEVLGHGDDAVTLDRADLRHAHRAGEERILAEIFEVAAALRHPGEIHAGSLDDVQGEDERLDADDVAKLLGNRGVEGRGDRHRRRQRGGRGLRPAVVLTDADGTVGDAQRRDPQPSDPGHVARAGALRKLGHTPGSADKLLELLGGSHGLEQTRRPLRGRSVFLHPWQVLCVPRRGRGDPEDDEKVARGREDGASSHRRRAQRFL